MLIYAYNADIVNIHSVIAKVVRSIPRNDVILEFVYEIIKTYAFEMLRN